MQKFRLGIRDLLVLAALVAVAIQLASRSELRFPIFFIGWTATCFLELTFLRDLWRVGRPGLDHRPPFAIRLAYPVCFTPFPVWIFAAAHLPQLLLLPGQDSLPDLSWFVALVPAWIYSIACILISFFYRYEGSGVGAFVRARVLTLYNLTVPLLLLVT